MKIKFQKLPSLKGSCLIVPVFKSDLKGAASRGAPYRKLDHELSGSLKKSVARRRFDPEGESEFTVDLTSGVAGAAVLVGCKEYETNSLAGLEQLRRIGSIAYNTGGRLGFERVVIQGTLALFGRAPQLEALLEGIFLSSYGFYLFKKAPKPSPVKEIVIDALPEQGAQLVSRVKARCEAVMMARDLINLPPSECTPTYLLNRARSVARKGGLKLKVYDRKALRRMGAGGILAVSRASAEPPYLIQLTYKPRKKAKRVVALVGKGITFDSGGLSIKTGEGMEAMKIDMSGAAAVLAAASAIGSIRPDCEVRVYIPTCENMISGDATKPGDIMRALNGKTVEILNTDAEGRLILADALSLASQEGADEIIDLATLTGACVIALGNEYAGLFSNDKKLEDRLVQAGTLAGERLWSMPLAPEYKRHIKSDIADLKNIGSRGAGGGAITAALFLSEFIGKTRWAHLDIAGPAMSGDSCGYITKGGVGFGVRTLLRFLEQR